MIAFDNTLEVARPPEVVFAALADLTRVPDWNYYVRSVTQVTPGPVTIGTIFHQVRQDDEQVPASPTGGSSTPVSRS